MDSFFHKWDYITITAQHTGYTLLPYGIYKGDELICLTPLYFRSTHGVKTLFSPPPMQAIIPYQGFVLPEGFDTLKQSKREAIMDLVASDLSAEINAISPHYLSLTLVPGLTDIRQFLWRGYASNIRYTYTIDLAQPSTAIQGISTTSCVAESGRPKRQVWTLCEAETSQRCTDQLLNGSATRT